jgi:hypothetical protein
VQGKDDVLIRVHSECLTGDVFASLRCDCGPQLEAAMALIAKEEAGVLVYLRQEGRGIGLLNKIKAYERDRRDVSASFDRLMIINRILSGDNNRYKATEFHNLKFQLSVAENRLTRLREIRSRKDQLEQEIDDLPPVPEVPQDIKKPLLDLWSRHNNKAVELSKLKAELSPQENMFKEKQDEIKVRLGNLSVFTQEEAHMVSSLAGSMQTAEEELNGLLERRQNERDKFSQDNENKDIDEIKKSLTSLESEGVDNARSYNSLIVSFQEQL